MRIGVIGAGVIGVTSAYMLARRGYDVILIDARDRPAGLSSHANGGQLSYSYVAPLAEPGVLGSMPGWLWDTHSPLRFRPRCSLHQWRWTLAFLRACRTSAFLESTSQLLALSSLSQAALHTLLQSEPIDFDLRRNGKLIVYRDRALLEKAARQVAYQAGHGSDQRILSPEEVVGLEPSLRTMAAHMAGAVYTPGEEVGDCRKFTSELYDRLGRLPRVTRLMNTTVLKMRRAGGRITAAHTSRGDVEADVFVIAGGMGSRALLSPLGQDAPLYPLKGYSLSVPLPDRGDMAPVISVTDYQRRIVYARIGGILRIAAMVDMGWDDSNPAPKRIASLKRHVGETFPGLALDRAEPWAGLRPATPSGKPLIGASPAVDNLWLNIGHGALGFTLACGSAALLASQIAGDRPPIDPSAFRP